MDCLQGGNDTFPVRGIAWSSARNEFLYEYPIVVAPAVIGHEDLRYRHPVAAERFEQIQLPIESGNRPAGHPDNQLSVVTAGTEYGGSCAA
ncbi:hypothetical protein GCM10027562_04880 [Arthrobacter pigmenti]